MKSIHNDFKIPFFAVSSTKTKALNISELSEDVMLNICLSIKSIIFRNFIYL
ncbi:hypothetical protein BAR153v2_009300 [Bartonella sp. AR 15-3]|nr:hypothetical protein BAR153v2_009300 [Bartonella sp. AR 15-3]CBI78992.1 hypothetical protein BAR15_120031 [Bartonella sp. AR 15-3]